MEGAVMWKVRLLLLGLLFLPLSAFCLDVPEVDLPEGWFLIHDTELTEIEEELMAQDKELQTLKNQLEAAERSLKGAEQASNTLSLEIGRLETFLRKYARENAWLKRGLIVAGITVAVETILLFVLH